MTQSLFDAAGFVEFDLEQGEIFSAGKEQLALVPLDILLSLSPSEELDQAARYWGEAHGTRLKEALGNDLLTIGVEAMAEHLGGTTAALGLGTASIEIQGDVLMIRLSMPNKGNAPGFGMLTGGFIAGYLSAVSNYDFDTLLTEEGQGGMLFFAGSQEAVKKVRGWIKGGVQPLPAIGRLFERSH